MVTRFIHVLEAANGPRVPLGDEDDGESDGVDQQQEAAMCSHPQWPTVRWHRRDSRVCASDAGKHQLKHIFTHT